MRIIGDKRYGVVMRVSPEFDAIIKQMIADSQAKMGFKCKNKISAYYITDKLAKKIKGGGNYII